MESFSTPKHPLGRLADIRQAALHSKLLLTAIELSVFDLLEQETTAGEVAEKLKTHPESTKHFLNGLTAIGLIEKSDGKFKNTDLSQEHLVKSSSGYLGDYLLHHVQWESPLLDTMWDVLHNGPPQREKKIDDKEMWAKGAIKIADYQRICTAAVLAEMVSDLPGSGNLENLLDLGGGPGLNTIGILQAHPGMRGTLFDRSEVLEVAEGYVREYNMQDRLKLLAGDFSVDPIGEGYDLVLATACLNFAHDRLPFILGKIHASLKPGGYFISVHDGLTHERTQPTRLALSWVTSGMLWQDLGLDQGRISEAMAEVGFEKVSSKTMPYGLNPMDIDVGRKP